MRKVKFTSIFLLFALAYAQEEFKFESEKLGKIKGEIEGTFSGQPYISFRGIPYASVKTNGRFMVSPHELYAFLQDLLVWKKIIAICPEYWEAGSGK